MPPSGRKSRLFATIYYSEIFSLAWCSQCSRQFSTTKWVARVKFDPSQFTTSRSRLAQKQTNDIQVLGRFSVVYIRTFKPFFSSLRFIKNSVSVDEISSTKGLWNRLTNKITSRPVTSSHPKNITKVDRRQWSLKEFLLLKSISRYRA